MLDVFNRVKVKYCAAIGFSLLLLLCSFTLLEVKAQVDSYLSKSSELYQKNEFKLSIEEAQKAYEIAAQQNAETLMAKALHAEVKALLQLPKKQKANRKKAAEKINEALALVSSSTDYDFRVELLLTAKTVAQLNGDRALKAQYDSQIDKLAQNQANEQALIESTDSLSSEVKVLNVQTNVLSNRVRKLSEKQLQSELLLALERNQVDSLQYKVALDSLSLAQQELTLSKQQTALDYQESQRNLILSLLCILGLIIVGLFSRYRVIKKNSELLAFKNRVIEEEKEKSEKLLLNILPSVVASELKSNGVAKARKHEKTTVFFSDFVNFSYISKTMSPENLVKLLDRYFQLFDTIIDKYGLEKIKTIGDSYMCVGGVPEENDHHPIDIINAALDIQEEIELIKQENLKQGVPFFEARIGIHSGPLVAGVVGSKKFAFDIWGDTVNIASRLESNGEPGKVNISANTYALVKEEFHCIPRGSLPIKNRGEIAMYFVEKLVNTATSVTKESFSES